jgi:hypothetical protein
MANDDRAVPDKGDETEGPVPVRATDPQKPGETVAPRMKDRGPGADPPQVEPTFTNTRRPAPSRTNDSSGGDGEAL